MQRGNQTVDAAMRQMHPAGRDDFRLPDISPNSSALGKFHSIDQGRAGRQNLD
jgi:hypothetical protein